MAFLWIVCLAASTVPALTGQPDRTVVERAFEKFSLERFDEVIALLEPERTRDYIPEETFRLLGSAYLMDAQHRRALDVANEAVAHYPRSPELRIMQMDALARIDAGKALEELERMKKDLEQGELASNPFSQSEWEQFQAGLYTLAGRAALEQSDYPSAIRHFEQAADLRPGEPDVHRQLLYVHLMAGQYPELLAAYERVPAWLRDDRSLVTLRSQALLELGDLEELLGIYRARYEKAPDDIEGAVVYGQLLMADNKLLKANELFNELIDRHPRDRRVYDLLMDVNRRQMNHHGMEVLLEQMVRNFPADEELPLELAQVRELRGDYDQAIAVYDSLIRHRGPEYRYIRMKAALLYRRGEVDQAYQTLGGTGEQITIQSLERIDTVDTVPVADPVADPVAETRSLLDPHSSLDPAIRRFDLGVLAFQHEQTHEAELLLRSYLEHEPGDSLAWMIYGRVLEKEANPEEALAAYRRAAVSGLRWPEMAILEVGEPGSVDPSGAVDPSGSVEPMENLLDALDHAIRDIEEGTGRLRIKAGLMMYGQPGEEIQPFYPMENQLRDVMSSFDRLFDFAVDILPEERVRYLLDRLMERHTDNTRVLDMAARFYRKSGQPIQALHYYKTAAELNPNDFGIHVSIAEIMEEREEWQRAVLWYERALGAGASSGVYGALIRVHRENGTLDQLIDRLLVRYRAVRSDPELREYLIDALHRAGRREEAREIVREK